MESSHEFQGDEPRRHPFLWAFAVLCLFVSVPFYYPDDRTPRIVYGLPDWCWITIIADTLFAIVVAYLILRTWSEPTEE